MSAMADEQSSHSSSAMAVAPRNLPFARWHNGRSHRAATGQHETIPNSPPTTVLGPFADALLTAGLIRESRIAVCRWTSIVLMEGAIRAACTMAGSRMGRVKHPNFRA
jgi:hypothetical protein